MAVGAVTFFNDRKVKRYYVKERQNPIVNRLNKTRVERQVDYEAERQERERAIGRKKKEFANAQVRRGLTQKKEALEAKRRHQEEAAARDYSNCTEKRLTQCTRKRRLPSSIVWTSAVHA